MLYLCSFVRQYNETPTHTFQSSFVFLYGAFHFPKNKTKKKKHLVRYKVVLLVRIRAVVGM